MKRPSLQNLVGLLACTGLLRAADATGDATLPAAVTRDILAGLRPEHPRLILTGPDWSALRAERGGTSTVARGIATNETSARELLPKPPVKREVTDRRLLSVSRGALRRIERCSSVWQMAGERKSPDRAEKEMLAAAAFPNSIPTGKPT
jgi:hypothetical protein